MKKFLFLALMLLSVGYVGGKVTLVLTDANPEIFENEQIQRFEFSAGKKTKVVLTNQVVFSFDNSKIRSIDFTGKSTGTNQENVVDSDQVQISVYPNPAKDVINIKNLSEQSNVAIYDIEGRLINRFICQDEMSLSVAGLPAGTYILQINQQKIKFIKE